MAKRPITPVDYESWRSIQSPQLSRDGKFVAYLLSPQAGDREYVIRNVASGTEWRHATAGIPAGGGAAGEGTATPAGGSTFPRIGGGRFGGGIAPVPGGGTGGSSFASGRIAFTADSKLVLFITSPVRAELDQARKENRKPEEMPRSQLCIQDLATGKVTRIPRVSTFQLPEEAGGVVAYRLQSLTPTQPEGSQPAGRPAGSEPRSRFGGRGGAAGGTARSGSQGRERSSFGTDLILRNLATGSEQTIPEVSQFQLTKDGKLLVYIVSSRKEETNGAYAVSIGSMLPPVPLLVGKGRYSGLTWDEKQTRLAFLCSREQESAATPACKVYCWERSMFQNEAASFGKALLGRAALMQAGHLACLLAACHVHPSAQAAELVNGGTAGLRSGWVITERGSLSFTQDGGKLSLSAAPAPPPKKEETPGSTTGAQATAGQQAVFELWHWKDEVIQPMQKVRGPSQANTSYRAVFDFKEKKLVHLADDSIASVTLSWDAGWGLGSDDRPYRRLVGFDSNYRDFYLVNTADGSKKPILQKHEGFPGWSPGGKYLTYFDGKHWHGLCAATLQSVNLTKALPVTFHREEHDTPNTPAAHGVAGWTADDKLVLLYDRHDIWAVSPDGSGARNITQGQGRKQNLQFRLVRLDPEERAFDLSRPVLLKTENLGTRDEGFHRLHPDGRLEMLIMAARSFSNPTKARYADVLVLTASTFSEFPDLVVTNSDFRELKKVTDANRQKEQLLWGKAELVKYRSADGLPLQGILVKPENFDPAKKYPMIVHIYERLSQGLHNFGTPRASQSVNPVTYASNGYLVLMPDIAYTVGYPGQSALKCVLPAIDTVVETGCVDEKAIGIQGHSWGGYQIAYMITQTNRFKAAAAGAPVANMTSAYGGIRWSSGLPRQFQYEKTQSRIGGSLWQYPMRFVENSPIFAADRVQTPLLMLHNDRDGAVPWTQGIEYYLALRRLGKEVYLFNYVGEDHGLARRPNIQDYAMRMRQFFDHHLKGAPMPEWMEKGIPYQVRDQPPVTPLAGGASGDR